MKVKDICSEIYWKEMAMNHSLDAISKYHNDRTVLFSGYGEEELEKMIDLLEDALSDVKSLRDFREKEYTDEESGA